MRSTLFCIVLCSALVPNTSAADEPYGVAPIALPLHGPVLREWKTMPQKFADDAAKLDACRATPQACTPAMLTVLQLIGKVKVSSGTYDLTAANDGVNALLTYVTDLVQWGETDGEKKSEVWTSPLAAVESGRGDCDEYANLKLFVLWQAGYSLRATRLVVLVKSPHDLQMHIVPAARAGGRWVTMEMFEPTVRDAAIPQVVYSLLPYLPGPPSKMASATPK